MAIYEAIITEDGRTFRYSADAPVQWPGMNDKADHVEIIPEEPTPVELGIDWRITRLALLNRLTDAELGSFYYLAKSDLSLEILKDKLMAATFINLELEQTAGAISLLVSKGVLTSGRATEILTTAPSALEVYGG